MVEKKLGGFSFSKGTKEISKAIKEKTDTRDLLYPKVDPIKTNHHANRTVMKKPVQKPKVKEESHVPVSYIPVTMEPKKQ